VERDRVAKLASGGRDPSEDVRLTWISRIAKFLNSV
jgi:hypothetical protein